MTSIGFLLLPCKGGTKPGFSQFLEVFSSDFAVCEKRKKFLKGLESTTADGSQDFEWSGRGPRQSIYPKSRARVLITSELKALSSSLLSIRPTIDFPVFGKYLFRPFFDWTLLQWTLIQGYGLCRHGNIFSRYMSKGMA